MVAPAITGATTIATLLDGYPFLLDVLVTFNPKFGLLKNTIARNTMGRIATIEMAARTGGVPLDRMLEVITAAIRKQTAEMPASGADPGADSRKRVEKLKAIVLELHAGTPLEQLKARFDETISGLQESEIAKMEEELIQGGLAVSEVQKLCDLHVGVMKSALDKKAAPHTPPGHPVHTYIENNKIIAALTGEIDQLLDQLAKDTSAAKVDTIRLALGKKIAEIAKIDIHYKRKEHQLFPFLERHEIKGPSKVMWGVHDEIRGKMREFRTKVETGNPTDSIDAGKNFIQAANDMIYKEEHILFPMALGALTEAEWIEIAGGERAIGFAFAEPAAIWPGTAPAAPAKPADTSALALDTGSLSLEQVNMMLKHLPMDVSFVDENDVVRYYSDVPDRIFPRSPGTIGRKVQDCHPQKSLDTVQQIIDEFRAGKKDSAEFWITMAGKFVHIRYFAMRDANRTYRGALEVTQDVTEIRKLEGQRRLLDWANAPGS